jgi:tRNA(Phe) wybutosine-synthesizing methylase Tyw3
MNYIYLTYLTNLTLSIMKTKLLLPIFMVFTLIGCSVDPIEENLNNNQLQEFNSETGNFGCAGPDNSKKITLSEASSIESWDEVRKLYLSLLGPGVARDGSFDPTIMDLINAFNDSENPIGFYTTTYTLSSDSCSDSVELTIEVIGNVSDPVCELSAGTDASKEIFLSDARVIESWDEVRKLYLSLLEPGVSRNGSFDPTILDLIKAFNNNENPVGDYTTTYTITEGECTDSVELTITVVQDMNVPPTCELNAGADNLMEISRSTAAAIESWDEVRKLYLSLLEPGVRRDGSFDPTIMDLIKKFNEPGDNLGDYTTTYTITDGECTDSVQLTMRVIAD